MGGLDSIKIEKDQYQNMKLNQKGEVNFIYRESLQLPP